MGFFKQKAILHNKTPAFSHNYKNDNKVIILLIDALREDFVDFGAKNKATLKLSSEAEYAYKGQKLTLFKKLRDTNPEQAILLPAKSAMPTVTVVRVKNFVTGGISTIFETTSEFVQHEVLEDNFFYQIKNRKEGVSENDKILFFGDHCWVPYFHSYFDEFVEFGTADTRDVDTLDNSVT